MPGVTPGFLLHRNFPIGIRSIVAIIAVTSSDARSDAVHASTDGRLIQSGEVGGGKGIGIKLRESFSINFFSNKFGTNVLIPLVIEAPEIANVFTFFVFVEVA